MNFADRLDEAIERTGNPCLVGIDPHLDLLPEEFAAARDPELPRAERADALARFGVELVDVVAGRAPAVKPQSAFFEVLGADGVRAWETVVRHARDAGLLVVGDVKRGDIASTATAYAQSHLQGEGACDAITVNPYLGTDSVEPFLEIADREGAGLFVLVRTSNPGSAEFQRASEPPLCEQVARAVARWGAERIGACGTSSVGAVVGATHPEELVRMRELMPRSPFLLPGYGAQGATAADLAPAFLARGRGALVAASRSVSFAYRKRPELPWKDAAARALDEMVEDVRAALTS